MCAYLKKLIFLSLFSIVSCFQHRDQTWDVIAPGLPSHVSPDIAGINMGLYILKQTHEPFLRREPNGEYRSHIFSKWSRNIDSQGYTFCLKDLNFSNGEVYSNDKFKRDLKALIKDGIKFEISRSDSCFNLVFQKSYPQFLEELTRYEYAPSSRSSNKKIELGLGEYNTKEVSEEKIILERKTPNSNGFNKIVFHAYSGGKSSLLKQGGIEDYNRVLIEDLPSDILKVYLKYPVRLLQTVNLLINHKDISLRRYIFNCIKIDDFRRSFMSKQKDFYSIKNILPVGIPGAEKGKIEQNCGDVESTFKRKINFFNWNKSSKKSISTFFKKFHLNSSIQVSTKMVSMSEFVDMVFKKPHPYNLTIVAIDAVRDDYQAFYGPIVSEKSIMDISLLKGRELLAKIKNSAGGQRLKNINQMNEYLKDMAVILPLYQEVRDFYFPKRVKGLSLGRDSLEYPYVSEISL